MKKSGINLIKSSCGVGAGEPFPDNFLYRIMLSNFTELLSPEFHFSWNDDLELLISMKKRKKLKKIINGRWLGGYVAESEIHPLKEKLIIPYSEITNIQIENMENDNYESFILVGDWVLHSGHWLDEGVWQDDDAWVD